MFNIADGDSLHLVTSRPAAISRAWQAAGASNSSSLVAEAVAGMQFLAEHLPSPLDILRGHESSLPQADSSRLPPRLASNLVSGSCGTAMRQRWPAYPAATR